MSENPVKAYTFASGEIKYLVREGCGGDAATENGRRHAGYDGG